MSNANAPRLSKRRDVDMTEGNIVRHLLTFAIPLLIGNLFQQMYNMVDTWVVGRYVSNEAYAAVGTLGPVTNTLIGFFSGLASGAGVVISQYYGAKKYDRVQDTVHTALLMTLCLGVLLTAVGLFMIPYVLEILNTPTVVLPESRTYLTIYFSGLVGLMIYNIGAGILRAVGDSRRPFYFLVVCALMNIVLDLVFVLGFEMGVKGVALATIISQFISAILVIITLMGTDSCIKLELKKLKMHWDILRKIIKVGIPAAIQLAITAFSNVFVQSYINNFQEDAMSGWTTYSKVDQLLFLPMQSIALSGTTFVGQNLGKGQIERAKEGVKWSLILALSITGVMMIPVILFAPYIVAFFNSKTEVVYYGSMLLRWVTPFYLICCFNQVFAGVLRGSGDSKAPMIINLFAFVFFRQIYMFFMSRIYNDLLILAFGYPAGWLLASILCGIYYKKAKFGSKRLVDDN